MFRKYKENNYLTHLVTLSQVIVDRQHILKKASTKV